MALSQDDIDVAKAGLRLLRNEAIAATDWQVLPDSPLDESGLEAIKGYRQYLRDLPDGMSDEDFGSFDAYTGLLSLEEWEAE